MGRRCLVIGASGQLGSAVCAALRSTGDEVIEGVHRFPRADQVRVDLCEPHEVASTIQPLKPEWIIIAGAFCGVDRAETEREVCVRVNVKGPQAIAEYANDHGAFVVYYSTDHIFDGAHTSYTERDPVRPLNVYARSKAEGEAVIRARSPQRHLVIRTASLYGGDRERGDFVLRLVDQLRQGERVPVAEDQWGSPTSTEDLAQATRWLMARHAVGTFHATGPEFVDRVSFARTVCAHFDLEVSRVIPTPTHRLGQPAQRPLRVHLDCRKLFTSGCPPFRSYEEGLRLLRQWEMALQGSLVSQPQRVEP